MRSDSPTRPAGDGSGFVELRAALLARTIEAEIIPRLMLAHRDEVAPRTPAEPNPSSAQVIEFAMLAMGEEARESFAFIAARRAEGMSIETLFLWLLTPAARHLGELWVADLCSFADVTVGLSRLQRILRELSAEFEGEAGNGGPGPRILLVTAPGDQHTFGVHMVEVFFRRAGWDVWGEFQMSDEELVALVRREWFDVIGLSASCDVLPERIASTIQAMRLASCNSAVGIMVGGRLFLECPELVERVGADATAPDAREAVMAAPRIVSGAARL